MPTLIWGVLPQHIVSDEVAVDRFSQSADESVDDEEEFWQSFFEKIQPIREGVNSARRVFYEGPVGNAIDTVGQLVDDAADIAHSSYRLSLIHI